MKDYQQVKFEKMKEEFQTPWLYALIPCKV
jgi:hypothetical protein